MKYFIVLLLIYNVILSAVTIPKSSLQTVKDDLLVKLNQAENEEDQQKYKSEIAELDKKIKKFELEWLQHRKNQLSIQNDKPEIAQEINEIESLIKVRQ